MRSEASGGRLSCFPGGPQRKLLHQYPVNGLSTLNHPFPESIQILTRGADTSVEEEGNASEAQGCFVA